MLKLSPPTILGTSKEVAQRYNFLKMPKVGRLSKAKWYVSAEIGQYLCPQTIYFDRKERWKDAMATEYFTTQKGALACCERAARTIRRVKKVWPQERMTPTPQVTRCPS